MTARSFSKPSSASVRSAVFRARPSCGERARGKGGRTHDSTVALSVLGLSLYRVAARCATPRPRCRRAACFAVSLMMRSAVSALQSAARVGTLGRVRSFAEGTVSASPELEHLRLQLALEKEKSSLALALEKKKAALALALEEEKSSLALALEKKKSSLALALEDKKAAQGRGLWEAVFGIKREKAQMLNLAAGGAVFISSGTYLVTGVLHRSWQRTHEMLSNADLRTQAAQSKAELGAKVAQSKAEAAHQDVRALMSNAQRAWPALCAVSIPPGD